MTYNPMQSLAALLLQQRNSQNMGYDMRDPRMNMGALMGGTGQPPGWNMVAGPAVPMRGIERLNPQPRIDRDQGYTQPGQDTQSPNPGIGGSEWRNETPERYAKLLGILRGQGMSDAESRAQAREMLRRKGLLPPGEQAPAR